MPDKKTTPDTRDPALHTWVRIPTSEPLRCSKCGTYYASEKGSQPCPAMHEAV